MGINQNFKSKMTSIKKKVQVKENDNGVLKSLQSRVDQLAAENKELLEFVDESVRIAEGYKLQIKKMVEEKSEKKNLGPEIARLVRF